MDQNIISIELEVAINQRTSITQSTILLYMLRYHYDPKTRKAAVKREDIASFLGYSVSTVKRDIKKLEEKGFIAREENIYSFPGIHLDANGCLTPKPVPVS
jgi:DNA-binding MarR family transcriptional regulator